MFSQAIFSASIYRDFLFRTDDSVVTYLSVDIAKKESNKKCCYQNPFFPYKRINDSVFNEMLQNVTYLCAGCQLKFLKIYRKIGHF